MRMRRSRRTGPAKPLKLGILLAVSALVGCKEERAVNVPREDAEEKHCVGEDGRFAHDALCEHGDGGATGTWIADQGRPDGGTWHGPRYHWVYVPLAFYGGPGSSAAGFLHARSPGMGSAAARSGAATSPSHSGAVSRGGFGATGAGHASSSAGA